MFDFLDKIISKFHNGRVECHHSRWGKHDVVMLEEKPYLTFWCRDCRAVYIEIVEDEVARIKIEEPEGIRELYNPDEKTKLISYGITLLIIAVVAIWVIL